MKRKECFVLVEGRPFSQAVRAGDFIFVSGTLGTNDEDGRPVVGLEAQTRQSFKNIQEVLKTAGASLSDVVKVQVFLTQPEDWSRMNEVYIEFFKEERPARSTIVVDLARSDALIEIECIAYKP